MTVDLLINIATSILFLMLILQDRPLVALVASYAISALYNVVATVEVWRSAARYSGSSLHAALARVASVILMTALTVTRSISTRRSSRIFPASTGRAPVGMGESHEKRLVVVRATAGENQPIATCSKTTVGPLRLARPDFIDVEGPGRTIPPKMVAWFLRHSETDDCHALCRKARESRRRRLEL